MNNEETTLPVIVPLFRDLFVIMDPGRDQDDEDVLVGLNRFIRLEVLNVMGVVANLALGIIGLAYARRRKTA